MKAHRVPRAEFESWARSLTPCVSCGDLLVSITTQMSEFVFKSPEGWKCGVCAGFRDHVFPEQFKCAWSLPVAHPDLKAMIGMDKQFYRCTNPKYG